MSRGMRLSDLASRWFVRTPASVRGAVASMRGLYLRAWRYGPETEGIVREVLERESWNERKWADWRAVRLAFVLRRAATEVPYYRALWEERRRRGDGASWELLENWPVLEKSALQERPQAFIADGYHPKLMFHEHTSGTSGASLDLWRSLDTVRRWYALNEARWRGWYGVTRSDRWAIFGGKVIAAAEAITPPYWVWNAALHQLYCSSYHLGPATAAAYVAELKRREISYLLGYTSALHSLAAAMTDQQLSLRGLKVVVTNAEPLFAHQREAIERAFGCPVRESYGLAEMVTAASECEHGTMHLWPEAGVLEVMDGDARVPDGESGDLVGTSLLGAEMPLIRYRIGDRGALPHAPGPCACGRTLPRISSIDGRCDDVLYLRDGRAIGRLDPVFKAGTQMREAQIIQESLGSVRVRYVPAEDFHTPDGAGVIARLRDRMGDIAVTLEPIAAIPRDSNGKFRAVISQLSSAERALIGR